MFGAVGHQHTLPQQVCDRVLIINKGHIVAEDTPHQLQVRLSGAQRFMVQVRGDSKDILPLIKDVPGVMAVEVKSNDRLECETMPGQDARPAVARAIIQGGYDLLQLESVTMSLEEIFLQLTREDAEIPVIPSEEA